MDPLNLFRAPALFFAFVLFAFRVCAQPWYQDIPGSSSIYSQDGMRVGIGTHNPITNLELSATNAGQIARFGSTTTSNIWFQVGNSVGSVNMGVGSITPHAYVYSNTGDFYIAADGDPNPGLYVQHMGNGNVGIGTSNIPAGYRLAVHGSAIAEKLVVKPYSSWSDYVFDPGYRLRPLREVECFIQQNHHLPEVPSATEVEKNGIDVGQNQSVLLKKIEELTLYMIDMEKKMAEQQKELVRLRVLVDAKK